jgi:hypothetical protein
VTTEREKRMERALNELFTLIDNGTLVRNISDDGKPGWAMRQLPLVHCLSDAKDAIDLPADDALDRDAARWNWAKDILSGSDEPVTNAKTLFVAAGLMRDETIDKIVDSAIAAAKGDGK